MVGELASASPKMRTTFHYYLYITLCKYSYINFLWIFFNKKTLHKDPEPEDDDDKDKDKDKDKKKDKKDKDKKDKKEGDEKEGEKKEEKKK